MSETPAGAAPLLSVVVPVYNESVNLAALLARLRPVLEDLTPAYEIVFVDDGSRDDTAARIAQTSHQDPRIRLVPLSRNFGHQAALLAGLEHAL